MRHRKQRSKLSMQTARRDATVRNMVKSLIQYQRIEMTLGRAKVVKRLADNVMHMTKTDSVVSRRKAYDLLQDRDLVMKLFKEIGPLFKNRSSGYTRILTIGTRKGDGAQMAFLELTDRAVIEKLSKKTKKGKEEAKADKSEAVEEVIKSEKKDAKHDESKTKHISKAKLTPEEEKSREKVRSEEKKMSDSKQGFMKNIRGLFRKRGDF
ncbi:MAG: 50S ribosomal protein L17 [Candidatus Omnitrophota bacterium]